AQRELARLADAHAPERLGRLEVGLDRELARGDDRAQAVARAHERAGREARELCHGAGRGRADSARVELVLEARDRGRADLARALLLGELAPALGELGCAVARVAARVELLALERRALRLDRDTRLLGLRARA